MSTRAGPLSGNPAVAAAALALVMSCQPMARDAGPDSSAARREIAAAMERYQVVARTVNPDSMANFFTSDAVLFEPGMMPMHTRDAIRAFLASFPGAQVHVATATPDTIEVYGATGFLWGSYFERLSFPGQPTSEQHGKFVTQWLRQNDGRWLIHRMYRIPLPSR